MFNTWINAFIKPKETFAAEKANANLGKGVINFLIAGVIGAVLSLIISMALPSVTGVGANVALGAISLVTMPILTIIFSFIFVGIIFVIGKLFGATGSYTTLYYLFSLYQVPVTILSLIPFVNILVSLYALYLAILAVKESQNLTMGKAALVVLIPIILIVILAFIIALLVGFAIFSAIGGMTPTGAFGLA